MSVRVNLLPGDVAARSAASRGRMVLAGAGVLLLVVLAGVHLWELGRVNAVEEELAAEQAQLSALQSQVVALQEFQDLEDSLVARQELTASMLRDEVSFAGILQDIAAVTPSDTSLATLSISTEDGRTDPNGINRTAFGRVTFSGVVIGGHAPGVERILNEYSKVGSFFNVFFSGSTVVPDSNQSTFSADLDLGVEIRTSRYLAGLPEEMR